MGFCCDELALLALSAMYQRHTLVVTKNKFWSTIESAAPLNILEVMKHCTVRLLYVGNLGFGILKWKPRDPKPPPPPVHPRLGQFDIVEEYTIDDNGDTERDSSMVTNTSKMSQMLTKTLSKLIVLKWIVLLPDFTGACYQSVSGNHTPHPCCNTQNCVFK